MSARETKDGQWGRHTLCHDLSWVRKLRRSTENISVQISRGKLLIVRGFSLMLPKMGFSVDGADRETRRNLQGVKIKIDLEAVVDLVLVVL